VGVALEPFMVVVAVVVLVVYWLALAVLPLERRFG